MVFNTTFNNFQLYCSVSFIGRYNRSIRRRPPTCHKSLTNIITRYCVKYTSAWVGFQLTTLVVIDPKYHWTIWLQIYGTIPWTNKKVIFITHVHGLWLTLDVCCIYIFNWQSTLHFHSEFLYFLQNSQNLQPCHLSLWFQKEELLNAVKYMWKGR